MAQVTHRRAYICGCVFPAQQLDPRRMPAFGKLCFKQESLKKLTWKRRSPYSSPTVVHAYVLRFTPCWTSEDVPSLEAGAL